MDLLGVIIWLPNVSLHLCGNGYPHCKLNAEKLNADVFCDANILHGLIFNGLECLRLIRRYAVKGDTECTTLWEELDDKLWNEKQLSAKWKTK